MPDLTHGDDAAAVNSLRSAVMRLSRRLKHQRVDESLSPTEMSVLGTLPIFIAVAFMQKYLVRGMSLGAVKG